MSALFTVSAAITTRNRSKELAGCVGSILCQSSPVDEIIIVDDGSEDDTADVIASISKEVGCPIRYIYQYNQGVSAARNTAFREAGSEFVAFLDDDDRWGADHIALFRLYAEQLPQLAVFSGMTAKESNPNKPNFPRNTLLLSSYEPHWLGEALFVRPAQPLQTPFFTPSSSTSIIKRPLGCELLFDEELMAREDVAFFWQLSEKEAIVLHQEVHAVVGQMEVSLLSVKNTDRRAGLEMDLKRSYWDMVMFMKVLNGRSRRECPILYRLYGESLLGYAYFSCLSGDKAAGWKYLWKSFCQYRSVGQLKLLFRLVFNSIKRQ